MKTIYIDTEVLNMTNAEFLSLEQRNVKLTLRNGKTPIIGKIKSAELTNLGNIKPFCYLIENVENNEIKTIGILSIKKIEVSE